MLFSTHLPQPMRTLASATMITALAATLGLPNANAATAVYNNLASSQDGSDPVFSYGPLADSFTTGADLGLRLIDVKALLKNDGPGVVGTIHIGLHADSGSNTPGAELVSLGDLSSAAIAAGSFASYSFAPAASSFTLAQNTRYWVQIDAVTPNAVSWSWSNDTSALGVAGQFSHSAALGTSANDSFGPYQMSVSVAAVPEPDAALLALVGLGCVGRLSMRRRLSP